MVPAGVEEEPTVLCPICQIELKLSHREEIEIDYCPKCRGVWLDRGELDKIIQKSLAEDAESELGPPPSRGQGRGGDPRTGSGGPMHPPHPGPHPHVPQPPYPPGYDPDDSKWGYRYGKRRSIWRDLLDF